MTSQKNLKGAPKRLPGETQSAFVLRVQAHEGEAAAIAKLKGGAARTPALEAREAREEARKKARAERLGLAPEAVAEEAAPSSTPPACPVAELVADAISCLPKSLGKKARAAVVEKIQDLAASRIAHRAIVDAEYGAAVASGEALIARGPVQIAPPVYPDNLEEQVKAEAEKAMREYAQIFKTIMKEIAVELGYDRSEAPAKENTPEG